ncbi:MAG TPA: glycosyltransferase [Candidatus Aminicenantes bacterium]|nr:MAG: glycosyl transferase [Candidatus Aminicenantes bacterium]HEK86159.1 glycosyltransferase [Candidatus Aminicenantes bacterium]
MRILTINSVYNSGSTGKIIAAIHKGLLERRYVSSIAYGRGQVVNEPGVYRIGWDWEVRLHALHTRLLGTVGHGSILGTRRLMKYMDEFKPDVIHLHNIHGYFVNVYMLIDYIRQKKIPVVWTLHDNWVFTGRCGYFYECERWKSGCGDCPNLAEYPATLFFDRSASEWKRKREAFCSILGLVLTSPSQWLADDVRLSFLGDKWIEVVPNGIDTQNTFYPRDRNVVRQKLGIPQTQPVVLAVALDFTNERKGGKYVIELAKALERDNIKILIVGWIGNANNLPPNVIVLPPTRNQHELAEFYSAADVFVITSRGENFPTVVLESLACGTPVVGFRVGGIPEQVKEHCGITVAPGQIGELREAVLYILSNRNTFARELCRKTAVEKYSNEVMIEKYIGIYRRLLGTDK